MRALRGVRDRASLAPSAFVALIAGTAFFIFVQSFSGVLPALLALSSLIETTSLLVLIAVFFAPVTLFVTNVLDRRASFRLLLQQEYVPFASTLFLCFA